MERKMLEMTFVGVSRCPMAFLGIVICVNSLGALENVELKKKKKKKKV